MDLHIRDAIPADQPIIAEFNSRLAEETEGKVLDPGLLGHGIAAILSDSTLKKAISTGRIHIGTWAWQTRVT